MNRTLYPQTKIEWYDNSQITPLSFDTDNSPLFLCAFTSDKGPEDMREVSGVDFFNLYGNDISFARHGQALLQTAAAINSGARVLAKRFVASDAKLANTIVSIKVETEPQLPTEEEITSIKYTFKTTTVEADDKSSIDLAAAALLDEGQNTYPLFAIYDVGRGVSNKKFRISPDFSSSKYLSFLQYRIDIIENSEILESLYFSINPNLIYNDSNYSIANVINNNSSQVKSSIYEDGVNKFIEKMASILKKTTNEIYNMDILFGNEKTGVANELFTTTEESINLNHIYGIGLQSGSNGSFSDAPINAINYGDELLKVFNGEATTDIYDVVNYQIDAVIDANYPAETKRAIEALAEFRQDFFYFRDLGFVNTIAQMKIVHQQAVKNKFSASYHSSYDIIDPYSKKQIKVTIGYSLSKLLVNHFKNGRHRPVAGKLNNMVITDAIPGTINFLPRKTPSYDEFEQLNDLAINYVTYYQNDLVLDLEYTCQEEYTDLSFINNVLAVQELIKELRIKCPANRYTFLDGDDFTVYKKDIERIIEKYNFNFATIEFVYTQDETMIQNNIFYAEIKVKSRNFVQAEYFKIFNI